MGSYYLFSSYQRLELLSDIKHSHSTQYGLRDLRTEVVQLQ